MKHILIALGILGAVTFIANLIMSTFWLQVALASVLVVLLVLIIFFAGGYIYRDAMMMGADIVLRGHQINEAAEAKKMQALGTFGREVIKVKSDSLQAGQQYPALPPGWIDGQFTITGLDDGDVKQ